MAVRFEPLRDMVLIEQVAAEKKIGSIFVPENAQDRPNIGVVIAVGPGDARQPQGGVSSGWPSPTMSVKVGDTVVFERWSGFDMEIDGKEYKIIPEGSIFGRMPSPP